MKLQISFELTNLSDALDLAKKTHQYADIIEVGTLLIYKEGVKAVEAFRKEFPDKEILADIKICDRPKDAVKMFVEAGANIITVLAGTSTENIHNAVQTAHSLNAKIALDLMDSYSAGQSAIDAENLGVDLLIFIRTKDPDASMIEDWSQLKANTKLPIFIAGHINKNNIKSVIDLNPSGIAIGKAIISSSDPVKEIDILKNSIKNK